MKTKIINLLGAVLSLLVTFGLTQSAAAQTTPPILFIAPITVQTSVKPPRYTSYQQIFSMNEDGTGLQQLTTASASSSFPSRSPDYRYIAFVRDGLLQILEAKGEGAGARIFAVAPSFASGTDWFADGSKIVFCGSSVIGNGLWTVSVNPDTGEVGTPERIRDGDCFAPSCSPDGTKIAFHAPGGVTGIEVRVLDLATHAESTFGYYSISPSWKPDGSQIAFTGIVCYTTTKGYKTTTNCYYEICTANPDGSGKTPMTNLKSQSGYPTWSPDETKLAFRSDVSGTTSIYKTTIGSGTATLLYSGGNLANWAP